MTTCDLLFPLIGTRLPSDQGYAWFSAICKAVPEFHDDAHFGIETVAGTSSGDGSTVLPAHSSLRLRLRPEAIPLALRLSGKRLVLDPHSVRLGTPRVVPLAPHASLYSRVVTIKGFCEEGPFEDAIRRQLDKLEVSAEIDLGPRRVLRVGRHTVVGFSTALHHLCDEDSLTVQERGVGGRRHMGAGLFVGIPEPRAARATTSAT